MVLCMSDGVSFLTTTLTMQVRTLQNAIALYHNSKMIPLLALQNTAIKVISCDSCPDKTYIKSF